MNVRRVFLYSNIIVKNRSVLFLLILFKLSIQDRRDDKVKLFDPDVRHARSLVCYQCNSSYTDLQPVCDSKVFNFAKPEDRLQRLFVCPPHRNSFCFLEVLETKKGRKTKRGCMFATDSTNIKLKTGCVQLPEKRTICLCHTHKCNGIETVQINRILISSLIVGQIIIESLEWFAVLTKIG